MLAQGETQSLHANRNESKRGGIAGTTNLVSRKWEIKFFTLRKGRLYGYEAECTKALISNFPMPAGAVIGQCANLHCSTL